MISRFLYGVLDDLEGLRNRAVAVRGLISP
jgi:hypothetical protein